MSIQSIGLYYGAWISQKVVRDLAGGELLLGMNEKQALDALHFEYSTWDSSRAAPQFEPFMVWLKSALGTGAPAIVGIYHTDGENDSDYDHIVPVTGVRAGQFARFDGADTLVVLDNYGDRIERRADSLAATRASCAFASTGGGCIPRDVDYGVAVTGFVDKKHATLPVFGRSAETSEPNVSIGEKAGTVTLHLRASGLTAGANYALLRYDDRTKVPTDATPAEFLASAYDARVDFTATGAEWNFDETKPVPSDGTAYYRCVPR
jgi:hypothetical protein